MKYILQTIALIIGTLTMVFYVAGIMDMQAATYFLLSALWLYVISSKNEN